MLQPIHADSQRIEVVQLTGTAGNLDLRGPEWWIKEQQVFAGFEAWQEGYAALTHSLGEKDRLIEYIKGQEEHHRGVSFLDEYRETLRAAGMELDERYLL